MKSTFVAALIVSTALVTLSPFTALVAQTGSASADSANGPPPVTRRTLVRTGIITLLATGAAVPLDRPIARRMASARVHGGTTGNHIASAFNNLGGAGSVAIPVGMTALGWVTHRQTMFDVGLHATEAVVVGSGITEVLKGAVGRARPTPGPQDSDDFKAGAGFGNDQLSSFPSGHTTAAFALATSLTLETERTNPNRARLVGITTYGLATTIGLARLYTSQHWTSDVVFGAGVGTMAGLFVEQRALRHWTSHHRVLDHMLPTAITPTHDRSVLVAWNWMQ